MKRRCLSLLAASFTRRSDGGKVLRLCVRPLAFSCRFPLGRSLHHLRNLRFDFVRWLHRYYEPVRLPASARPGTPVVPCARSPSPTNAMAPAGPPGFQWLPFTRDAVLDPGGAMPSRIAMTHIRPSSAGTNSASTIFGLSGLSCHIPCNSCLRFRPCVTATPARLGLGLSATTLAEQNFHLQVTISFSQRTPACRGNSACGRVTDDNSMRRPPSCQAAWPSR